MPTWLSITSAGLGLLCWMLGVGYVTNLLERDVGQRRRGAVVGISMMVAGVVLFVVALLGALKPT